MNANTVSHLLESRPDAYDLEDAGVLQSVHFVAPALQAVQNKLKRKMTSDALGHLLETRPDWEELCADGIIKDDEKVAPRIQGVATKLERRMNADAVSHLLGSRADPQFQVRRERAGSIY